MDERGSTWRKRGKGKRESGENSNMEEEKERKVVKLKATRE